MESVQAPPSPSKQVQPTFPLRAHVIDPIYSAEGALRAEIGQVQAPMHNWREVHTSLPHVTWVYSFALSSQRSVTGQDRRTHFFVALRMLS